MVVLPQLPQHCPLLPHLPAPSWVIALLLFSQVITGALQCLIWVLRFPLPSIETKAGQLTKHLFLLLKNYARLGAARGQNFHLVVNCFKVRRNSYPERESQDRDPHPPLVRLVSWVVVKIFSFHLTLSLGWLLLIHCCDLQCVTIVVKKVKSYKITEKQLQVLLAYAEEDIYDTTRQATAFGLLKV